MWKRIVGSPVTTLVSILSLLGTILASLPAGSLNGKAAMIAILIQTINGMLAKDK